MCSLVPSPLGPPRAHELLCRVGMRIQSRSQQLATFAGAEEVDRVCGESTVKESAATCQAVDEAVLAINWLHGVDHRPRLVYSSSGFAAQRTSELHFEAQQPVEEAVLRWPSAVCAPDDATSLREVLKGRGGYSSSASQANLAPYEYSRVSVPESAHDSPFLEEILDVEDCGLLKGCETRVLRTPEALAGFLCECGELSCHTDPVLKRNVRAHSKFVRRMHGVGLVDYSLQCECELGVFFVHKKSGGKIWLILDCRRANARFRAPPGTELLSSEGFSHIQFDGTGSEKTDLEQFRLYLGVGTWPTASTDCASREVSRGFSVGRAFRPPMGNVLISSAEFGRWLTAYLWVGAGACTLHRKPTSQLRRPVVKVSFVDRGQPQGSHIPLRPRGQLRETILGGASCEGGPWRCDDSF